MKLELRAITNSDWKRDSAVMMSSTRPSTKYSCSGSPLMFWNGSTAIDGLSGSGSARRRGRWLRRHRQTGLPAPDLNRSRNVLERLRAAVVERGIETVAHILMHAARYANASRRRDLLQAGSNVDAVAEDVVALDDDVAEVDADAEGDAPILGYPGCACSAIAVCTSTAQRTALTTLGNSSSRPSPVVLTMRPPCAGDGWVDDLLPNRLQRRQRAALVSPHQPRVARDVGRHDGGEAALLGHSGMPAIRRPSSELREGCLIRIASR